MQAVLATRSDDDLRVISTFLADSIASAQPHSDA
jgi:hypothetical protein